jgi:hypothetical protein
MGERRWRVYYTKKKSTRIWVLNSVPGSGPEFKTRAKLTTQKSNVFLTIFIYLFLLFTKKNLKTWNHAKTRPYSKLIYMDRHVGPLYYALKAHWISCTHRNIEEWHYQMCKGKQCRNFRFRKSFTGPLFSGRRLYLYHLKLGSDSIRIRYYRNHGITIIVSLKPENDVISLSFSFKTLFL